MIEDIRIVVPLGRGHRGWLGKGMREHSGIIDGIIDSIEIWVSWLYTVDKTYHNA